MKKRSTSFLIALSAIVLFTTTSCTREYTCQCQMIYSGAPGLPEGEVREYMITDSKKNAESKCRGNSREYDNGNIHTIEECDLF